MSFKGMFSSRKAWTVLMLIKPNDGRLSGRPRDFRLIVNLQPAEKFAVEFWKRQPVVN